MISFEWNKDEANTIHNVIERYLDHLQVEIVHTDKREFREALKQRDRFLREIVDRLNARMHEAS
jgi:hypothetical protein